MRVRANEQPWVSAMFDVRERILSLFGNRSLCRLSRGDPSSRPFIGPLQCHGRLPVDCHRGLIVALKVTP